MHQDFEETTRAATIAFHPDRVVFENPGSARAHKADLLEPAKDVRNPLIVSVFRRVGLSEQAGTGISAIFSDGGVAAGCRRNRKRCPLLQLPPVALGQGVDVRTSTAISGFAGRPALRRRGERPGNPMWPASGFPSGIPGFAWYGDRRCVGGSGRLETQVLANKIERPSGACYELAQHLHERWPLPGATTGTLANLVTDQAPMDVNSLVTDQAQVPGNGGRRASRPID